MSDTGNDAVVARTPVTADAAAFVNARTGDDATSSRRAAPRLRRDDRTETRQDAKRLIPAASAFDLLDGEYVKNRKSRILSVVSLGFSGLIVVLLLAQLLRVRLEIANEQGRYDQATASARANKAELDKLSQFGGVPGDLVAEAVVGRSRLAAVATELEVDVATIVADLTRDLPAGVVLTEVQIDAPAADAADEGDETVPTYVAVTVLASVESYDKIAPFLDRLRTNELLAGFEETWEGKPPRLQLRVTVKVPLASTDRYQTYAKEAGKIAADGAGDSSTESAGGAS